MTVLTSTVADHLTEARQDRTRLLLSAGAATPLYVAVSLAQAVLRPGFDLRRHAWSMLANGEWGWVQVANLGVTGLLSTAFAVGVGRVTGSRWLRVLLTVFGVALVAAAVFRADPGLGFPVGTPEGPGPVSWHGILHFAAGGIGFPALAASALVMARRFARQHHLGWAVWSALTGLTFLGAFFIMASSGGSPASLLGFTAVVVATFAWLASFAVHLLRTQA